MQLPKLIKRPIFWLGLVLLLAAALRLSLLDSNPSILNRDEAALGYNALLIAETGKDESGTTLPLAFESFGDFKLGGYIYTLALLFQVLPYADWVVRLPTATAGITIPLLGYWLSRKVGKLNQTVGILIALWLATQPVLIFFSRMAFEAMLALAVTLASLVALCKWHETRSFGWLIAFGLGFLVATLTYNTPWILLLPLIGLLPVIQGPTNWRKWLPVVVILSGVFVVSTLLIWPAISQKQGISIFTDDTIFIEYGVYREQFSGLSQTVLGNQFVYWAQLISNNLVNSLSYPFLVEQGGTHPWHAVPGTGHLTWLVYGLGWIGVVGISVQSLRSMYRYCRGQVSTLPTGVSILVLTLLSLGPAVITVDAPHATRSLFFMVGWTILAGFGLSTALTIGMQSAKTTIIKKSIVIGCVVLSLAFTARYAYDYFERYPRENTALQPGFEQVLAKIDPTIPTVVIDEGGYQYIVAAWYLRLPANIFFDTIIRQQPNQIGLRYGQQVANLTFLAHPDDRSDPNQPYVFWNNKQDNWVTVGVE